MKTAFLEGIHNCLNQRSCKVCLKSISPYNKGVSLQICQEKSNFIKHILLTVWKNRTITVSFYLH